MSEWLTTGQMIDRLKVGEVAKCIESDIKGWTGSEIISQKHMWKWKLENGDTEEFFLSAQVQKCKWRIIPKLVTFEEAMKALKEGKEVRYYTSWNEGISYLITPEEARNHGIKWLQINDEGLLQIVFDSKWSIEE